MSISNVGNDVYSPYKIATYPDKIKQLRKGQLPNPCQVQIDLTNKCNLDCSFCFYRVYADDLKDWDPILEIPTDKLFELLDDLEDMDVEGLHVTGGGSPEMHPSFDKFIEEALCRGFNLAIATNGTLLNEKRLNMLKYFDWVRFSVDTSDRDTWSKIKKRPPELYDKVIQNIKKLVEIRDPKCYVGYSVILCRDNWQQIVKCTKQAKELGCQNVRFSIAHTPEGEKMFEGVWDKVTTLMREAKTYETKDFRVFAFPNRIDEIAGRFDTQICQYHHFVAVISPSGVYPCCFFKDREEYNFGKIQDKSFKEIWNSSKRREFAKRVNTTGCTGWCWMRDKNAFMNYLMQEEPPHRCFI